MNGVQLEDYWSTSGLADAFLLLALRVWLLTRTCRDPDIIPDSAVPFDYRSLIGILNVSIVAGEKIA